MAKRFYDTGLVDQEWYMELSPKHKALYLHLLCKCDIAGVFEVNYRMMSMYVNDTITEEDVFCSFGNRVVPLANSTSKGIIVDFIGFQCGGCVNPKVKAHASILKRLKELGLTLADVAAWSNHELKIAEPVTMNETVHTKLTAEESAPRQETQSKRKERADDVNGALFERFWSAYPRHDAKKVAKAKFDSVMSETKDREGTVNAMLSAIKRAKQSEQWTKSNGQFIPMPATWLNQRRWEDEGIVDESEIRKEEGLRTATAFGAALTI